ncbi:MAG: DUF2508 family protein [Ignavibacteriales bacterium]
MRLLDRFLTAFQETFIQDLGKEQLNKWTDYNVVEVAKKDWQIAQMVFNEVNDPDLVDFAVYNLKAAEKKYTYLLKKLHAPEESNQVHECSV